MTDYVPVLAINDEQLFVLIIIAGGLTLALVGIVAGTIKSVINSRLRETTRREIAAYIAEGSMTHAEGERLLNAGPKERGGCS